MAKTKTNKKKAAVEEPKAKNWLITINRQSYRYVDPYYHVKDVSQRKAIERAIAYHYQKHPTSEIENITVAIDTNEHFFVPDPEPPAETK